jgi:hypothetical protein
LQAFVWKYPHKQVAEKGSAEISGVLPYLSEIPAQVMQMNLPKAESVQKRKAALGCIALRQQVKNKEKSSLVFFRASEPKAGRLMKAFLAGKIMTGQKAV